VARPGRPVDEVVLDTLGGVAAPVLIAASMTFLGFFSQIVMSIVSVREMGIYSSVGIIFSAVFSLTLVPALLALLPIPTRQGADFWPGLSAALRRLVRRETRHRSAVLVGAFILALLAAWPIPAIQVGSNFLAVFREDHPIQQAADRVGQHLAGTLA